MATKKRSLSVEGDSEPTTKRRKIDTTGSSTESKILNIRQFVQNDKINDVTFTVGVNHDIEQFRAVKSFFAAQSDVLCNMLYGGMAETVKEEITISDITKEAFAFLREYCYLSQPVLQFSHVIDILYAAQKYMIHRLNHECNEKILSVNNIDSFFCILQSIAKYAPSTFESTLTNTMNCAFAKNNIKSIITSEKLNLLPLFEMKLLVALITFDEFEKYTVITKYCKHCINNENSVKWQSFYTQHFEGMIDFSLLNVEQLMSTVRNDAVISEKKLLDEIDTKMKEMQSNINQLQNKSDKWQKSSEKWEKTAKEWESKANKSNKSKKRYVSRCELRLSPHELLSAYTGGYSS